MLVIVGIVVVIVGVVGGFTMAGGNLLVLIQPSEFVTIGGAVIGSLLISTPMSTLKKMLGAIPKTMTKKEDSKEESLNLLKSFYDLFVLAQRNGLLSLEKHVENPAQSEVLSKNEKLLNNQVVLAFVCDTLKVMLSGGIPPHEIEELMETEIETFTHEKKPVTAILTKVSDALPGLGIVAAVLGIIVTMGSINDGAEAVGHHVAAALVGTFLGVLLSYGFMGPLVTNIELMIEEEVRYMETIKACIVAYSKGNPPIIAVEIARRTIATDYRPTFSELEQYLRGK